VPVYSLVRGAHPRRCRSVRIGRRQPRKKGKWGKWPGNTSQQVKFNFVENLPRKNTTITTFHTVSKEGTGLFTDLPNFCYRVLFALSLPSTQNGDLSALCWDEWIKHLLQPRALGSLCGVRVGESIAACDCVTTVVIAVPSLVGTARSVTEERAPWCGR
jgi:hypothetical protein